MVIIFLLVFDQLGWITVIIIFNPNIILKRKKRVWKLKYTQTVNAVAGQKQFLRFRLAKVCLTCAIVESHLNLLRHITGLWSDLRHHYSCFHFVCLCVSVTKIFFMIIFTVVNVISFNANRPFQFCCSCVEWFRNINKSLQFFCCSNYLWLSVCQAM